MSSEKDLNELNIPAHVAIIPDGNRRWAKEHGLPSLEGHRRGLDRFEELRAKSMELGVKCLTTWIFSTENWKRSEEEVNYLFSLGREALAKYKDKVHEEKIRFVHLGRKDRLPKDLVDAMIEMEETTKDYTRFIWALGFDYGGRNEIIRAVSKLTEEGKEISTENISSAVDTGKLPTPDLIIRTGREQRLSGFMLWQCEYAELYFAPMHFPDFSASEYEKAILDFANRERRFGGNSDNTSNQTAKVKSGLSLRKILNFKS